MRLLELFSGTKSVGKAFESRGWEVVSVDIDFRTNPTHVADMLQWQCPYPPGHFDHIHASPPCTQYSRAKTTGERDLTTADLLVGKSLYLIMALKAKTFTIENPVGMLRHREFMQGMEAHRQTLCYCKYADWGYKKPTDVWSNMNWTPLPMCTQSDPCDSREGTRHPKTAQRGSCKGREGDTFSQSQLYRIPPALCDEWAQAAMVEPRWPMLNEVQTAGNDRAGAIPGPGQENTSPNIPHPPNATDGPGEGDVARGPQGPGNEGPGDTTAFD
jgi:hypothetical protein